MPAAIALFGNSSDTKKIFFSFRSTFEARCWRRMAGYHTNSTFEAGEPGMYFNLIYKLNQPIQWL